jgi:chromosomal replication initiation ATPase DnaA
MTSQNLRLQRLEERVAKVEALAVARWRTERTLLAETPIAAITADAAHHLGLSLSEILSADRSARLFRARAAIAHVARATTDYSLVRIAKALNRRDHTVTLGWLAGADRLLERDPAFRQLLPKLLRAAQDRKDRT